VETGPLFTSVFGLKSADIARAEVGLLCLHGVEAHGVRFIRQAELLPDATIVAPDLRGHGRSPKHGPWTLEQHVRDVAPLLRKMGPRAIVVGHSVGGLVAWELASYAPDQLRALVLVDPAIAMDKMYCRQRVADAAELPRWTDQATAFTQMMEGRDPRAAWSVALTVALGLERDEEGWLQPRYAPEAVQHAWREMGEKFRPSLWRGPTLLIEAGRENGTFVSKYLIRDLRQQLGDSLQHVVMDAPHSITAEAPEELAAHVEAFVGQLGR
jgi:lipase